MQTPLQIAFKNMQPSEAIEAIVRERAAKLERFFDRIIGCSVVVEAPHRHKHKGKLYNVRLTVSVPGKDIHVGHTGSANHAHEDVKVAIRDAFDTARRLLEDHARKMRGDVKTHAVPEHGRVLRLFDDYGFAETADGMEVYFHKNSVTNGGFEKLTPGSDVRIVVADKEGEHGPQASAITPIGKHHVIG